MKKRTQMRGHNFRHEGFLMDFVDNGVEEKQKKKN